MDSRLLGRVLAERLVPTSVGVNAARLAAKCKLPEQDGSILHGGLAPARMRDDLVSLAGR
jgi:hypothetical protein